MRYITVINPERHRPKPPDGIVRHTFPVGRYTVTITVDLDSTLPGARSQTVRGYKGLNLKPSEQPNTYSDYGSRHG